MPIRGKMLAAETITPREVDRTALYDYEAGGGDIRVSDVPANIQSSVNQGYVDSVAAGLRVKPNVVAVEIVNSLALTGLTATPDGVTLSDENRVLLTVQSNPIENGIWVVHPAGWTRPADFAAGGDASGAHTFATRGVKWEGTGWVCVTDKGSAEIDADPLQFSQFGDRPAIPTSDDKNRASAVTSGNYQTTGLTITNTPARDGYVEVGVGGEQVPLGDGVKTAYCYFSVDGGTTARPIADIQAGDTLYWNGVVAEYDLDADDRIDFNYNVR